MTKTWFDGENIVTQEIPEAELYKRPWQGLTDDEFLEACQLAERGNYLVAFQRIQAKLKERNNGH
jgi:hypothetical protein